MCTNEHYEHSKYGTEPQKREKLKLVIVGLAKCHQFYELEFYHILRINEKKIKNDKI
jgi:hypothetical protein